MKIVAIADLHVGSRYALAKPGKSVPGEDIRKKIYAKWEAATKGEWSNPDIMFIVGDAIEGQNRKSFGIGTWTSDLQEQVDEACELIAMWKPKRLYIVRGSGYHVNVNNSGFQCEELIARALNAEVNPDGSGDHSAWYWYVTAKVGDYNRTFHVEHFIQGSRFFHYKATPVAREMMQGKLTDRVIGAVKKYKTDIVLRAHTHGFIAVKYANSLGMVLPCWKGLDEYALSRGSLSFAPDIGYVHFSIDKTGYSWKDELYKLTDIQPINHVVVEGE